MKPVVGGVSIDPVGAVSAADLVVPVAPVERVVARLAPQRVGPVLAAEHVVPVASSHRVVARVPAQEVDPLAAFEDVVAVSTAKGVVPVAAGDLVRAGSALEVVTACGALQDNRRRERAAGTAAAERGDLIVTAPRLYDERLDVGEREVWHRRRR